MEKCICGLFYDYIKHNSKLSLVVVHLSISAGASKLVCKQGKILLSRKTLFTAIRCGNSESFKLEQKVGV